MNTKITYPLFFQSLSGAISIKICSDDRGIKVDKNNIIMDPEEVHQISTLIKLSSGLDDDKHLPEILRKLNLVPLDKEAFVEYYNSVQNEINKRLTTN